MTQSNTITVLQERMIDAATGQLNTLRTHDEVILACTDDLRVALGQIAEQFQLRSFRAGTTDTDAISAQNKEAAHAVDLQQDPPRQ